MKILYCLNPLKAKEVEENYLKETQIALSLGIQFDLFNFDEFVSSNRVLGLSNNSVKEMCVYRGWMMTPSTYSNFYTSLQSKGFSLINSPQQYKYCHWLPESYDCIQGKTPKSIWIPNEDMLSLAQIFDKIQVFNGKPIILKDYVKSLKHFWKEACFISDSSDKETVNLTISNFLKYQSDEPQGGLVFREFVELEPIGFHSKSGMPLTKEFRLFYLNNTLLTSFNYWDEGQYSESIPDLNEFNSIAKQIRSNFFTMDIAKTIKGEWIIVELGDGQVAGLPENANVNDFYKGLKEINNMGGA